MRYFPAFHDLSIRPSLVVGGGEAAARKLRLLLKAGARAVVVAPQAGPEIAGLARDGTATWHPRAFTPADIDGCGLVIAANAPTLFTRLLAGALTLTFFTYAFVNMGMVSGILPVVGVPLPLISYGGTSLVTILFGVGLLMSIHTHRRLVQT